MYVGLAEQVCDALTASFLAFYAMISPQHLVVFSELGGHLRSLLCVTEPHFFLVSLFYP